MSKTLTITEVASEGGKAQKEIYSAKQMREWGKRGGRPKGSKDKKPRKSRLTTTAE
jgi:hypothetical protein